MNSPSRARPRRRALAPVAMITVDAFIERSDVVTVNGRPFARSTEVTISQWISVPNGRPARR
jgi:hypothetical protein